MGKLNISDDLRGKLDNVLGTKMGDVKNNQPAIAPAPKWINEKPIKSEEREIVCKSVENNIYKNEEREIIYKKKRKKNYLKKKLILFSDSIIVGMGILLGLKIGTLLFY